SPAAVSHTRRWATFDCYGTLIDWEGGISGTLRGLWPEAPAEALLDAYHRIEPRAQQGSGRPYREVSGELLPRVAAAKGLPLRQADEIALGQSLPSWPA